MNHTLIPEWRRQDAVLLSWPHAETDWCDMLDEVDRCYLDMTQAIGQHETVIILTPEPDRIEALLTTSGIDLQSICIYRMKTNDTWIRDYGPLAFENNTTGRLQMADFTFNGWGMKFAADKDNQVCRKLFADGLFAPEIELCNHLRFVLEGGSVESDGLGTILTTRHCLMEANRNAGYEAEQFINLWIDFMGSRRLLMLEHGQLEGDDTDGHIDTLVRFLTADTLVYTQCTRPEDSHFAELEAMEKELKQFRGIDDTPYHLLPLPLPSAIHAADGHRLPATYANFLFVNGAILLPVYGVPEDEEALRTLQAATPRQVIPINCRALIEQHGSLHCATMQIPEGFLSAQFK